MKDSLMLENQLIRFTNNYSSHQIKSKNLKMSRKKGTLRKFLNKRSYSCKIIKMIIRLISLLNFKIFTKIRLINKKIFFIKDL